MNTTKAPSLKDIISKPLIQTGDDIPDGSYPGVLMGFGEPFWMPIAEQFRKEGGPTQALKFEATYAIRLAKGKVVSVDRLLPVPEGGTANRRSNVYKDLKALGGGDRKLMTAEGAFATGVTLTSFIGCPAMVVVKANKKEFPTVESIAPAPEGLKYPSPEEVKAVTPDLSASEASGDVPF